MALESFLGLDMGEGMDEAAFEAFKERMKAAAAQIAAIKKDEKKQKQKEDKLLKILLKFIKTSHKKQLVLLISRTLEQNVPAGFVLAIILLGNEEVREEVKSLLMLKRSDGKTRDVVRAEIEAAMPNKEMRNEKALFFFTEDETLPLKVKIEMDAWMKALLVQVEEIPQKVLKNAYDVEFVEPEEESDFGDKQYERKEEIKVALVQLVAFVARDFLENNQIDTEYEKIQEFAQFILKGILNKARENLDNRKLLEN